MGLGKLLDDQQQLLRGLGSSVPSAAQEQVLSLRKQIEKLIEEVDDLRGCADNLWSFVPSDVDPTCSSIVSKTCPRVRLGPVRRARQKATMREQGSSMLLFKAF